LSLYNSLRTLSYNHAVVGAKLDLEMFTWMSATDKKKLYSRAMSLGIQPFHIYSILDTRMVDAGSSLGKKEKVMMVRL
jgi:hypothetical protein